MYPVGGKAGPRATGAVCSRIACGAASQAGGSKECGMRDGGDLPRALGARPSLWVRLRREHTIPRRLLAAALGLLLALLALAPVGPAARLIPIASAHAVLVRSDPADHAVLQTPPSSVHLWFSEEINPITSRVVVVDP